MLLNDFGRRDADGGNADEVSADRGGSGRGDADRSLAHFEAREVLQDIAAFVWPVSCVGCGAADRELCAKCRRMLREAAPLAVESTLASVPAYARGPYSGILRAVIVAYKHGGRAGFARPLGEQLAHPLGRALAHATEPPILVAVPSRAAQVRRRGFRHVDSVLQSALTSVQSQARPARALRSTRGRVGQVGLDAADRAQNAARVAVRESYRPVLKGREIILVDDIMTTGATVRAACDALTAVGASVVAVAALAAVMYEGTPEGR